VALALKHERPDLRIIATDISPDALAVARANAAALKLEIDCIEGDLLAGLGPAPLDAILSNPPYVPEGAHDGLQPELAHEPPHALFAGPDGLDVLRRLVPAAAARAPFVALEVGAGQAAAVTKMMRDAGLREVVAHRDLAGIERVVVGTR
jgi:release factor glutamine methyltransferase